MVTWRQIDGLPITLAAARRRDIGDVVCPGRMSVRINMKCGSPNCWAEGGLLRLSRGDATACRQRK